MGWGRDHVQGVRRGGQAAIDTDRRRDLLISFGRRDVHVALMLQVDHRNLKSCPDTERRAKADPSAPLTPSRLDGAPGPKITPRTWTCPWGPRQAAPLSDCLDCQGQVDGKGGKRDAVFRFPTTSTTAADWLTSSTATASAGSVGEPGGLWR